MLHLIFLLELDEVRQDLDGQPCHKRNTSRVCFSKPCPKVLWIPVAGGSAMGIFFLPESEYEEHLVVAMDGLPA